MSLPSAITQAIKHIPYNPGILATQPQLAYTLSFLNHPISNEAIHFHPRDSYHSPLSQYQFADFDDATYDHLLEQTVKNYRSKNASVVKGIRSSFKEFYARVSALTYQSVLDFRYGSAPGSQTGFQISKHDLDFRIQALKGNIPSKWPEGLNQFQKQVNSLPWNAFSTESHLLLEDIITQIKASIANHLKKLKSLSNQAQRGNLLERVTQQFEVLIMISLKTLNQGFVLGQLLFSQRLISQAQMNQDEERVICQRLSDNLKRYLSSLPDHNQASSKYHHNQSFWNSDAFLLMKKLHFQKCPGLAFYSLATDGTYLYINVSAINGGMYKFGTGNNGTVAGKLYFQKQLNLPIGTKIEEVNWVYLNGHLYLKSSNKDPSTLDVISPEDFRKVGTVQLACKSLFGHNVLNIINKNSILMTDGQHLYFLGKRIKISQNAQHKQKNEEKKEDNQQKVDDKNSKKQKKKKKNENQQNNTQNQDNADQSLKTLEIVLVQFDPSGKIQIQEEPIEEDSITEIFESFGGYFTIEQCRRAYRLNHYDVMEACQWLFDEGSKEKERNIRVIPAQRTIVLCESQITSNFNEKTFKNPTEIVTKEGSMLHMYNVNESIWTMDEDEITCYSENGVKIFSKKPEENQDKKHFEKGSSLLVKKEGKYPRNPEYTMVYDPYNRLFYTFAWFNDGRHFPCPVLVSKDGKEQITLEIRRRSSVDTTPPQRISEVARYYLTELSLLEHLGASNQNYTFNDHVWWYGQKINKLNSENVSANADEKKKISNKKAKVMAKLNKINDLTKAYQKDLEQFKKNGKVTREIIKLYPFYSDGSSENLTQILEAFRNIENCPGSGLIAAFLVVIEKWLINSSSLADGQITSKIDLLLEILIKIRDGPSTSQQIKHEINRVIMRHLDTFYREREGAVVFLTQLSPCEVQSYLKELVSGKSHQCRRESIVYEISKKELLIAKYDSKYNFNDIFKGKSNADQKKASMVSFLLIRKYPQPTPLHCNLLSFLQSSIVSSQSQDTIEFLLSLFTLSFKQISNMKNSEQKLKYLVHLFEDVFKVIEKTLSSCSKVKTLQIVPAISLLVQVYYSSVVRLLANKNIIKSLLKTIELIQKPELVQFYISIKNQEFEGISAIQEKIYETCHPLERGKSQQFPSANYPESSFLLLDFDKRCQSDQNHDIMTIQLLHEQNAVGNSIPCHDGAFSTHLRLTGKVDMKKPVLMLGNNVSIDFNSSGHAKDAQSFGRFGFKFGLRPVMGGKLTLEKGAEPIKIEKTFKSQQNFKCYVETLKFLVVAVSCTLESLFSLEEETCEESIRTLLKGKIVRQGLEQTKKNQNPINLQQVINSFLQKEYETPDKQIMKEINLYYLHKQSVPNPVSHSKQSLQKDLVVKQKIQNPMSSTEKESIWSLEGIPQYIKGYIEEIRNFKGGFIQVFKEAREHAPPQGSYSHQLRRPGFTPDLKQLWLQGEALLFLTVLKHSGLLHLNLKFSIEYIKENLKAFEEARNGIFYAFISRMQTVREWRDLVETYHGKPEEEEMMEVEVKEQKKFQEAKKEILISKKGRVIRTVQFQSKEAKPIASSVSKRVQEREKPLKKSKEEEETQRLKQAEKAIRERLNNEFLIQQLCNLKGIAFVANNIHENVSRILEVIKKADVTSKEFNLPVYVQPIEHLIKGCLFLLGCKSPSTKQSLEEDHDIVPMGLGRSLSSDHKNADNSKVELFREWLQNWKKWKGFKKENKIELKFPVLEIVDFINSWVDVVQIKKVVAQRTKMCEFRVEFYRFLNHLLKSTNQSVIFSKYAFGSEILNLTDNFKSHLESAPLPKLQQLTQAYNDYVNTIKDIQTKFIRDELPTSYQKFSLSLKPSIRPLQASGNQKYLQIDTTPQSQKEFLDKLKISSEILYMLQSENPQMNLEIALYFINLKFLSTQNEEILFLASLLIQRAFVVDHKLQDILKLLKKEVGNNNLSAKRWKDLLFIERVSFLLRKLQVIIRKKHLEIDEKQHCAETLFYLLNLTDVPFLTKTALKLLKKLKDVTFSNISTLFSNRYKIVKLNQSSRVSAEETISIQNSEELNSVELLAKKSLSIFKPSDFRSNEVQEYLLRPVEAPKEINSMQQLSIQEESVPKETYNIVLNVHQEEDLVWLLRVLYYIEELQRQSGKGSINELKDWKDYIETKTNKQNKKNEQQQQQANNALQQGNPQQPKAPKTNPPQKQEFFGEKILSNFPDKIISIDPKLEEEMPIGWYMSYGKVFREFSNSKVSSKPSKQPSRTSKYPKIQQSNPNNQNKKAWPSTLFLKLSKKFDEFNSKPLEEPKETDSEEVKAEFVRAKNFVMRIRKHLSEIMQLVNQFTNFGYVVFREDLSKEKALELCQLISLGAENKLKPIKIYFNKDEYKNRIVIEDTNPTTSKIKITLISSQNYGVFEELISLEQSNPISHDSPVSSYIKINKKEHILEDAAYLPFEDFLGVDSSQNETVEFCREFIQSNIFKMKKRQEEVYLPDYPKLKYFISQGGIQTGLKNATLVPASEHSLTVQSVPIEEILTSPKQIKNDDSEETDFPEEIIQKLVNLIQRKLSGTETINNEQKMMNYLLASFYLKKLSSMELKFVSKDLLKNLANRLVSFSEGFKSFQPIEQYESQTQKLLIKFIDNKQTNLKIFEVFNSSDYEISPTIVDYLSKTEENGKGNEIKTEIKEDISTHHFPKSQYLLKSQAPQVQQNKLLKYWEKNILPKIYEFVKTTLKPLEIDDFFEQMRMPLRKNDQMEAKKIAYVICDNKLPQGAVLPDSNHNWNSFTLEDIHIGQYALVKLPKQPLESISPLLKTGFQEYRLVKIVFIDVKAPSILVRYRIDEYATMGYAWVPINSLVRVEKQIMHLSPQHLYAEIDRNVKGMIYGYSKLCLTQLTSVSNLDQEKLIKETITDLFIHDPISGWLSTPSQEWSMRHVLKSMIENNNLEIISHLEKEFCPIQSFETDLFTDSVMKLNRFENAKALIVSFKKTAGLSLTSGIRFYKDPYLFNEVMHVYTTKSEKTEFQPLIFNDPNIFCKYYTNKECLKPSEMNKYNPKPIQVTVFGVEDIWTIGCYLGEVISQMAEEQVGQTNLTSSSNAKNAEILKNYLEILKRINKLYIKWILSKKVAVLCSQLSKLVCRITHRILSLQEKLSVKTSLESLGVDQQTMKDLLAWVRVLLQEEEKTPLSLYSELLQNLSEMSSVLLRKTITVLKNETIPEHIEAMINLQNVLIRIEEHLKGTKISQKFEPLGQWERFLMIDKIPDFVDRKELITKIKSITNQNKGKILAPKFDIFPKNDKLLLCVEGWNITELVEEEVMQKIQKEEEEEKQHEEEDQGLIMEWICPICTFINPMGNSHCDMCQNEMPPPPVAEQVYEQVQATDVSKAENRLKEMEAKRFETIKEEILKFFQSHWEDYCKKTEKRNKEVEEEAKNRVVGRKKQEQKEDNRPKPIPEKPAVQLKTGSEILNDSIIEAFLELRWEGFKESVKKLVEGEESYLSKFKKLQTLGYDLWCDHIYHQSPSLLPLERLQQLMNYIQGEICKGSSSVLSYSQNSIRLLSTIPLLQKQSEEPINYQVENNIGVKTKYKNLAEHKSYNIRYSWKIVKQLNVAASKCLQFINMNLKHQNGIDREPKGTEMKEIEAIKDSDCLGAKVKCFRNLIMGTIKLELTQKIIQKTSVLRQPQEVPKIYVERLKVREERGKDRPVSIKEKEDFLFTKAHEQFSKVSPAMLRPFKPKGTDPYLSFSITFRGEMAMGEAGPYRQFFTDISTELDPKNHLGLFIPTPNNKHATGQAKSKWTINPKANAAYHLNLFQFLGTMMGCCIRTGTHLALDLPKIFWKLLVGETVDENDIEETDHQLVETLRMIKDIPNEEMFQQLEEYSEPITWTFNTSDGQEHEMVHNGKNIKVSFEEREKYIAEVKRKRTFEAILQVNRIKKGLQEMMPEAYFNCITGDELKLMVCGRPKVDVDLLKKHTKYAGGLHEEERRIKYFWEVMREMEEGDKLKVIKFCWGQERLPINSEEFQRNNIRFMIKPMMNERKQDLSLPKADTCFFNIELPNYSTKEVLRQKLLLAINMDCVSINADQNFNPDDNPLMNEIEEQNVYDEGQAEAEW